MSDITDEEIRNHVSRLLSRKTEFISKDEREAVRQRIAALESQLTRMREALKDDPTEHCAMSCDWCKAWSERRLRALEQAQ